MISRRHLLQMMGLSGAGLCLPSLGGRSVAHADPTPIPRRIVFFYTNQGSLRRAWRPAINEASPEALGLAAPWSTTNHLLGELHQPLVGYKDRLLFLDGLDMRSNDADPTGAANAHIAGETHALTGTSRLSSTTAGGPSIDQLIAKAINTPNPLTRIPSLELYVNQHGHDAGGENHPLYAAAGESLPIIGSAAAVYDRLFPNGPVGTTPEDKAKLARSIAENKALLDYSKSDFGALASRVGKADRERLSAHAAAVGDLSNRIALAQNTTCLQPDRAIVAGTGFNQYELNADVMMRLTQTALACDLTRVVTLAFDEVPPSVFGYESVGGTTDFHDMVHKTANDTDALFGDPKAEAIVKRYYSYLAMMYAKLLALLDAIPEADGGTLLDHTLVVWCGQIASGDHHLHSLPLVLGGRMGGALKTGRYIRYPRQADAAAWPQYSHGPAHNDLFVALANMMGVPITTFGNASVCTGALTGLS